MYTVPRAYNFTTLRSPPNRDWVDIPKAHHSYTTCAFVYCRKLIKLRKTSRITRAEKLLTTNNKTKWWGGDDDGGGLPYPKIRL